MGEHSTSPEDLVRRLLSAPNNDIDESWASLYFKELGPLASLENKLPKPLTLPRYKARDSLTIFKPSRKQYADNITLTSALSPLEQLEDAFWNTNGSSFNGSQEQLVPQKPSPVPQLFNNQPGTFSWLEAWIWDTSHPPSITEYLYADHRLLPQPDQTPDTIPVLRDTATLYQHEAMIKLIDSDDSVRQRYSSLYLEPSPEIDYKYVQLILATIGGTYGKQGLRRFRWLQYARAKFHQMHQRVWKMEAKTHDAQVLFNYLHHKSKGFEADLTQGSSEIGEEVLTVKRRKIAEIEWQSEKLGAELRQVLIPKLNDEKSIRTRVIKEFMDMKHEFLQQDGHCFRYLGVQMLKKQKSPDERDKLRALNSIYAMRSSNSIKYTVLSIDEIVEVVKFLNTIHQDTQKYKLCNAVRREHKPTPIELDAIKDAIPEVESRPRVTSSGPSAAAALKDVPSLQMQHYSPASRNQSRNKPFSVEEQHVSSLKTSNVAAVPQIWKPRLPNLQHPPRTIGTTVPDSSMEDIRLNPYGPSVAPETLNARSSAGVSNLKEPDSGFVCLSKLQNARKAPNDWDYHIGLSRTMRDFRLMGTKYTPGISRKSASPARTELTGVLASKLKSSTPRQPTVLRMMAGSSSKHISQPVKMTAEVGPLAVPRTESKVKDPGISKTPVRPQARPMARMFPTPLPATTRKDSQIIVSQHEAAEAAAMNPSQNNRATDPGRLPPSPSHKRDYSSMSSPRPMSTSKSAHNSRQIQTMDVNGQTEKSIKVRKHNGHWPSSGDLGIDLLRRQIGAQRLAKSQMQQQQQQRNINMGGNNGIPVPRPSGTNHSPPRMMLNRPYLDMPWLDLPTQEPAVSASDPVFTAQLRAESSASSASARAMESGYSLGQTFMSMATAKGALSNQQLLQFPSATNPENVQQRRASTSASATQSKGFRESVHTGRNGSISRGSSMMNSSNFRNRSNTADVVDYTTFRNNHNTSNEIAPTPVRHTPSRQPQQQWRDQLQDSVTESEFSDARSRDGAQFEGVEMRGRKVRDGNVDLRFA